MPHLRESCMRENRTCSLGGGRRPARERASSDPTADSGNHRVQIFDQAGTYLNQFGAAGTGDGQFYAPEGIAIDPTTSNILVADTGNNRVEIFSSAGVYLSQLGTRGSGTGEF